jgi:hypothetical protein
MPLTRLILTENVLGLGAEADQLAQKKKKHRFFHRKKEEKKQTE